MMNVFTLFLSGTKLQWSSAITLAVFVWLFTAFWSAMPLIGWGEYDYEPLRTCCTLDYSKGDRYCAFTSTLHYAIKININVLVTSIYKKKQYILIFSHFSLHRNYVSYLIPMSIFNMAIQVFVVMSSYQSIAQKFKKTGNPRVSILKTKTNTHTHTH